MNGFFVIYDPIIYLDSNLPSETEMVSLPSGIEVAEILIESDEIDGSIVEEIIPGYFMKQDMNPNYSSWNLHGII